MANTYPFLYIKNHICYKKRTGVVKMAENSKGNGIVAWLKSKTTKTQKKAQTPEIKEEKTLQELVAALEEHYKNHPPTTVRDTDIISLKKIAHDFELKDHGPGNEGKIKNGSSQAKNLIVVRDSSSKQDAYNLYFQFILGSRLFTNIQEGHAPARKAFQSVMKDINQVQLFRVFDRLNEYGLLDLLEYQLDPANGIEHALPKVVEARLDTWMKSKNPDRQEKISRKILRDILDQLNDADPAILRKHFEDIFCSDKSLESEADLIISKYLLNLTAKFTKTLNLTGLFYSLEPLPFASNYTESEKRVWVMPS